MFSTVAQPQIHNERMSGERSRGKKQHGNNYDKLNVKLVIKKY